MPIAVGYIKTVTESFLSAMVMLAVIAEMTLVLGLLVRKLSKALNKSMT